jgi:hypothetical protein
VKPTEFPVQHLAETEAVMVGQADMQRQRARAAMSGLLPEVLNGYQGDMKLNEGSSRIALAAGFYESALAYYESARMVTAAMYRTIADLDRAAAREAVSGEVSPADVPASEAPGVDWSDQ